MDLRMRQSALCLVCTGEVLVSRAPSSASAAISHYGCARGVRDRTFSSAVLARRGLVLALTRRGEDRRCDARAPCARYLLSTQSSSLQAQASACDTFNRRSRGVLSAPTPPELSAFSQARDLRSRHWTWERI